MRRVGLSQPVHLKVKISDRRVDAERLIFGPHGHIADARDVRQLLLLWRDVWHRAIEVHVAP